MLYPKLCPVTLYDVPAVESWLTAQAAQGWLFRKTKLRIPLFRRTTPQALTYRLEPIQDTLVDPPPEQLALYEDCGWQYLDFLGDSFYVFVSADPAPKELHTDPVVQGMGYRFVRKRVQFGWLWSVLCLLVLAVDFFFLSSDASFFSLTDLVDHFFGYPIVLATPLFMLLLFYQYVRDELTLRRLTKRLDAGFPLPHFQADIPVGRSRNWESICKVGLTAVLLLSLCLYSIYDGTMTSRPLPRLKTPYPMVDIALLSEKPMHTLPPQNNFQGIYFRSWSPLQPTDLQIEQRWIHQLPRTQEELYQSLMQSDVVLALSYQRLRPASLTAPYFQAKVADLREWTSLTPLTCPGVDEAYFYEVDDAPAGFSGGNQHLFFRMGDSLLRVDYRGDKALPDLLPAFAAALQQLPA